MFEKIYEGITQANDALVAECVDVYVVVISD